MDLSALISKLEHDSSNFEQRAIKLLYERKNYILGAVKRRLYETGTDGNGIFMGKYSKRYERKKRRLGKRATHVTLNWDGDFWGNYDLQFSGLELTLFNRDNNEAKVGRLIERYGPGIFELGEYEAKIIREILKELEDGFVREFPEIIE